MDFDSDIENCLRVLKEGGLILYPTDTIWGIGCDATRAEAVKKIYSLKGRQGNKGLIVLLADAKDLIRYIASPDPGVFDYIENLETPTTIVFENAIGLAENLPNPDGSLAIRVVKDAFCRHLLKRFRKPIVSTSANISGQPYPENFSGIAREIREGADYVVHYRQEEKIPAKPSRLVKWEKNGTVTLLRNNQ